MRLLALVIAVPWSSAWSATTDASAIGEMFLSTRGFARTSSDKPNKNVEAETLHRQEFPYGAAPGWKWVYQGFSDGTSDTVNILKAGMWIQQSPTDPIVRVPLTFNSGSGSVEIPKEALQESDAISTEIKPGAVVWVTTWYRAGSPDSGLPFQTLMCTRESKPGLEDLDGTAVGPIGSLPDYTINGGFSHDAIAPLKAGQPYCARGYRPMGAVGHPSPDFKGTEIVPLFIGDSLNVQFIDAFDDKTVYSMRGFNGRFCAAKYPYMIFGQGGSETRGFFSAMKTPLFTFILGDNGINKRKVTHLLNEYGINSVRTHMPQNEIATNEWSIRQQVAAVAKQYGVPYLQSTLAPCTMDKLAGYPGANKDPVGFAIFVAQRQMFNDMVRTQSDEAHLPGCIGFWDPCTVVETDPKTGSDEWVKAYFCDGIHPNSAGHAAMAGTIPDDLLVNHPNPIPVQ